MISQCRYLQYCPSLTLLYKVSKVHFEHVPFLLELETAANGGEPRCLTLIKEIIIQYIGSYLIFFYYGHSQWVTVSNWLPLWFKDNAIFTWIWHTCVFSMFHDHDLPLRQLHTLNSGAPNRPISAWWSRRGCSQGDLTLIMVQRAHHLINQLIESQVPGLETVTSFSQ